MKKYIIIFVTSIIALGALVAINEKISINVVSLIFSYKSLLFLIILTIILFLLSLIGIPSYLLYLIFDLFLMGIFGYLFYLSYALKGILYISIYFIFKIPIYFLLILNSFYTIKYAKNLYRFIFNKFGQSIKNIKLYFKKIVIINIIITIINIGYTFLGSNILNHLAKVFLF